MPSLDLFSYFQSVISSHIAEQADIVFQERSAPTQILVHFRHSLQPDTGSLVEATRQPGIAMAEPSSQRKDAGRHESRSR